MPDETPPTENDLDTVCVCGHPYSRHNVWLKHSDRCYALGCGCQNFVTPAEKERARRLHEEVDREIAARRDDGAA